MLPIPELVLYEQNFLVLRDAGITVSAKIEDDDPFNPQKEPYYMMPQKLWLIYIGRAWFTAGLR